MTFQLTDKIKNEIAKYRHEVRALGTLGGCYQVALFIEHFYNLPMREGVYQSSKLEPIVSHRWNILPDGSILDSTADQFCEGWDIGVIVKHNEFHMRYRPQWSDSLNPSITPWLKEFDWLGITDLDWKKQNSDKKISQGFWLTNNAEYLKWRNLMSKKYLVYQNSQN